MESVLPTASLALAGCLWGTGFLFGKIALGETTVSENVAFRFLCGSTLLLPFFCCGPGSASAGKIWAAGARERQRSLAAVFGAICGTPLDHRFSCLADGRHLANVARPQFSPVFARAVQPGGIRSSPSGIGDWLECQVPARQSF